MSSTVYDAVHWVEKERNNANVTPCSKIVGTLNIRQDFLNMEFAFKYEMWELLRHEKFPEIHLLTIQLTGNALLFNGKEDILHIGY